MVNYYIAIDDMGQPYISHWGIKGQKWGVRRFQNEDGTLTAAGKERYVDSNGRHAAKKQERRERNYIKKENKISKKVDKYQREVDDYNKIVNAGRDKNRKKLVSKAEKYAKKAEKINNKISDFDEGTLFIKEGQRRLNNTIANYKSTKIAAVRDPSIRKTKEYKAAVKEFHKMSSVEVPYALLDYATDAAAEHKKER